MQWLRPDLQNEAKRSSQKKERLCPQNSVKKKKKRSSRNGELISLRHKQQHKVFAGLKHGFTRNWLSEDILFQIICGGGQSNVFMHEMHEILLKIAFN